MPPVRSGRASKACDSCRKQKTRCYDSENGRGTCLRCETLNHHCSLEEYAARIHQPRVATLPSTNYGTSTSERYEIVDGFKWGFIRLTLQRLARLERTVDSLVERLDSRLEEPNGRSASVVPETYTAPTEPTAAPVLLIRDVASEVGVRPSHRNLGQPERSSDIIARGILSIEDATSLLGLLVVYSYFESQC